MTEQAYQTAKRSEANGGLDSGGCIGEGTYEFKEAKKVKEEAYSIRTSTAMMRQFEFARRLHLVPSGT